MRAWLGVICIIAGYGCGKDGPAPAPAPAAPADVATLMTPGRAPTRVLRYAPAKGTRSRVAIETAVSITAGDRKVVIPPLVLELELAVEDVAPDGSARIRSTVIDASARAVDGASVPAPVMAQMTASLRGTAFTATLAPDGRVTHSKLESARALPPAVAGQVAELEKSVGQVAMPLPHEPVGVGATWTSRREIAQQGITVTAATTTTVTAIDGDRLSFTTATTMTAPGAVHSGGLTLSDVGGGGTASGTVDLARLSIDSKAALGFHGTMAQAGSPARIEWDLTLAVRPIAPGAPGAPGDQGAHSAP